jgi:hypothetical protein
MQVYLRGKKPMPQKFMAVLNHPKERLRLAAKALFKHICCIVKEGPFYLQGHMAINPKSSWHDPEFKKRTGGFFPNNSNTVRSICNLEPWDVTRRDMIILLLRTIIENNVDGVFAEVGVYRGQTAKLIHYFVPERVLHLFDTFEGFGERSVDKEKQLSGLSIDKLQFADTSLELVMENISPITSNIYFHQGYFPDSIPDELAIEVFAFVHLDVDLYEPTFKGLNFFYPRMNKNGFIIVHDYNSWPGVRKAVDDFFLDKFEIPIPMPDKDGSALIVKN